MQKLIFSLAIFLFSFQKAQAYELPISTLDHLDKVNIYIQTVDPGNLVYDNFGHTLVRVEDKKENRNYVFNWGVFSFGEPVSFALDFYRGYLNYTLGISGYSSMLRMFAYDKRSVYEDKLFFTNKQKEIFIRKLLWNQKGSNRDYLYQYFDDNCSTRPRDYVNLALDGSFKNQFDNRKGDKTYRDLIREAYASIPPMSMILDTILNSEIDVTMSAWQEAFLPSSFREILLEASNDGEPLISDSKSIMDFEPREKYQETGYEIFLIIFALIILSEILFMNFPFLSFLRRFLTGIPLIIWGIWAGILGIAFPITWLISEHAILKHNALMLLYLPLDFYFLLLGFSILFLNRICFSNFFRKYVSLHVIAYGFLLVLYMVGLIEQDVSRSLYFVCPGFIVSLYLLQLNKRKEQ